MNRKNTNPKDPKLDEKREHNLRDSHNRGGQRNMRHGFKILLIEALVVALASAGITLVIVTHINNSRGDLAMKTNMKAQFDKKIAQVQQEKIKLAEKKAAEESKITDALGVIKDKIVESKNTVVEKIKKGAEATKDVVSEKAKDAAIATDAAYHTTRDKIVEISSRALEGVRDVAGRVKQKITGHSNDYDEYDPHDF